MQEIWRASHPASFDDPVAWKTSAYSLSVRIWWGLCLAGTALVFSTGFLSPRFDNGILDVGGQILALRIFATACISAIIADLLLIYIIYQITQRQRERYRLLCD